MRRVAVARAEEREDMQRRLGEFARAVQAIQGGFGLTS